MSIEIAEKITIGSPLLNVRHEAFALAVADGSTWTEAARVAGYSERALRSIGQRLSTYDDIKRRVEEIRDAIADSYIMHIRERKVRLSEIARGTLKDFRNKAGVLDPFADGVKNQAALAQVEQEYDENGLEAYPTKIKLHNPVVAIVELNKMEGSYSPARLEVTGRDGGPIKTEDTRVKLLGILAKISVRLEAKEEEEE